MRDEDVDADEMTRMVIWRMRGNTPKNLRALSFSFDPIHGQEYGNIMLRAHFFLSPTIDDLEDIVQIEAESSGDLPDNFNFTSKIQIAPITTKLRPLDHMAWIDPAEAFRKS